MVFPRADSRLVESPGLSGKLNPRHILTNEAGTIPIGRATSLSNSTPIMALD